MKRQRRYLALVLALTFLAASSPSPARAQDAALHTASPTELAVIKVLLAQEAAWNRGDLDGFTKAYKDSPDTLFVSRDVSHGFGGILQSYRREYPSRAAMGVLGFSELEVRPLDEHFAAVVGRYHLERTKKEGGNAEGIFTLIFEKTEKGWVIVVDHTT